MWWLLACADPEPSPRLDAEAAPVHFPDQAEYTAACAAALGPFPTLSSRVDEL